jgi:hypothetical protein
MSQIDTREDLTEVEIFDYARRLFEARGAKAIAEAAQKASSFEQQGDSDQARTWRQIEAALRSVRGPTAS